MNKGLIAALVAVLLGGVAFMLTHEPDKAEKDTVVSEAAELRVGLKSEPSSIDPHYHNLGPNNGFATHIFGTLVGSDENQQHYPDLAVCWKHVHDTTWEFKLR